jgi:hypothetical protein
MTMSSSRRRTGVSQQRPRDLAVRGEDRQAEPASAIEGNVINIEDTGIVVRNSIVAAARNG